MVRLHTWRGVGHLALKKLPVGPQRFHWKIVGHELHSEHWSGELDDERQDKEANRDGGGHSQLRDEEAIGAGAAFGEIAAFAGDEGQSAASASKLADATAKTLRTGCA